MNPGLPAPDITASEVPIDSLDGTMKSIATAARKAGYRIRATRALGPRIPRLPSQDIERQASLAVVGVMHGWRFVATHTDRDGWDIVQHRPGWPPAPSSIVALRNTFRAQTPADLGKAR